MKNSSESFLSISTAWNYRPDGNVRDMLAQIKSVGINCLELGYKMTSAHVKETISLLDEYKLKVTSLHNFCPIPDDGPSDRHVSNYYRMSALDEKERQKAVQWTKNTIDVAKRVGAFIVVIHAGSVDIQDNSSYEAVKLIREGKSTKEEYQASLKTLLDARKREQATFVKAVDKSLEEIMNYAQKMKVLIGLETRYYPLEIPNYDEIGYFLKKFSGQGMYYWHDIGHAQVNDIFGITSQQKYLNDYKDHLIGMHIHGIKGIRDHRAPFTGDLDFTPYLPLIKSIKFKVIESHSNATEEEIKTAVKKLS